MLYTNLCQLAFLKIQRYYAIIAPSLLFAVHVQKCWSYFLIAVGIVFRLGKNNPLDKKSPVLVGLLSSIHSFSHPLTLTSSGHWAVLGNQRSGLTGETNSLPFFCAANTRCSGIQTCKDTALSGYQFTTWSSIASDKLFLVPREIHVRPVQYSNQRYSIVQQQKHLFQVKRMEPCSVILHVYSMLDCYLSCTIVTVQQ